MTHLWHEDCAVTDISEADQNVACSENPHCFSYSFMKARGTDIEKELLLRYLFEEVQLTQGWEHYV